MGVIDFVSVKRREEAAGKCEKRPQGPRRPSP